MGRIILTDKRGNPKRAGDLYEGGNPYYWPRRSQILGIYSRDIKDEVSPYNLAQMRSISRYLYANLGPVHGAINEKGTYSVGDAWLPVHLGANEKWGEQATKWLTNWFEFCDVRGQPYDFRTDLFLTSVSMDRDGDQLMILTQAEDGFPMLQFIPAHRIGNRKHGSTLDSGPYKGLEMSAGVVFNPNGRPVAYHVIGNDPQGKDDLFISARDSQLSFNPKWYEQGRGITSLAHAIKDFQDYRDIRDFEKQGIKAASATALIEKNETGSADIDAGAEHFDTSRAGQSNGVTIENLDGGAIRYYRANSGAGLETLRSERPSAETVSFLEGQILRGAYAGLEWPLEFSWNPERLGGANIRLIVAKAERTITQRQFTLGKLFQRAVIYGVAKAIKIGALPFDKDWAAWDAQLPPSLTVDAGYSSKSEIDEYTAGFKTLSGIYGQRGYDWKTQILQKIKERKFIVEECAASGVDPDDIQQIGNNQKPDPNTDTTKP